MTGHLEHRLINECAYALLNPLHVDKELWKDLPHVPLMPKRLDSKPEYMPVLVILKNLTPELRRILLERTQHWSHTSDQEFFGILIKSKATEEHTVHHLNRNLLLRAPGGKLSFLRFYDPRVFQHLRWMLPPIQLAALIAPATAWYWQDTDRQWQCEECPEVKTLRVSLQSQQVEALGRIGVLNRTFKRLQSETPNIVCDIALSRDLDAWVERAYNQAGLTEEADIQLYVLQGIRIHPDIHKHPMLQACLSETRAGKCSYVSACLNIENDELQGWMHRDPLAFKETV